MGFLAALLEDSGEAECHVGGPEDALAGIVMAHDGIAQEFLF